MRYIVLDTNCLLQSLPSRSPYHKIWTDVMDGKISLCGLRHCIRCRTDSYKRQGFQSFEIYPLAKSRDNENRAIYSNHQGA